MDRRVQMQTRHRLICDGICHPDGVMLAAPRTQQGRQTCAIMGICSPGTINELIDGVPRIAQCVVEFGDARARVVKSNFCAKQTRLQCCRFLLAIKD